VATTDDGDRRRREEFYDFTDQPLGQRKNPSLLLADGI
jgi:hypothetical protein